MNLSDLGNYCKKHHLESKRTSESPSQKPRLRQTQHCSLPETGKLRQTWVLLTGPLPIKCGKYLQIGGPLRRLEFLFLVPCFSFINDIHERFGSTQLCVWIFWIQEIHFCTICRAPYLVHNNAIFAKSSFRAFDSFLLFFKRRYFETDRASQKNM